MTLPLKRRTASIACSVALATLLAACGKSDNPDQLVSDARQYMAKGEEKAALIQLKNAAAKKPTDGEVRLLLGQLYNDMNDAVSAEKELRRARALGIAETRVRVELAEALMTQSQPQRVLDELKDTPAPTAAVWTLRGRAHLDLGQRDAARDAFDAALKAAPNDADALLGRARHALLAGEPGEANALVAKALASQPTHIDALMFEAELLRAANKDSAAVAVYDKVLAQKPQHAMAHLMKAHIAIGDGKYDQAKAELDAVRKATPRSLALFYAQARLDYVQGRYRQALDAVQAVLSTAPKHMPSVLMAGAIQYALGATAQAEQHFRNYLEFQPDNLYARKMLAATQLKTGNPDEMKAVLAPALKAAPNDAELYLIAGNGAMQRKDYGQAAGYFGQARAIAPGAADTHTALGVAAMMQNRNDDAIAELSKAVAIDAKAERPAALLVNVYLRQKDYAKAMAAVRQLQQQKPGSALASNLEGAVNLGLRNLPAARASFEKALTLDPAYWQAAENLAQLDLNAKKPEAAKQQFKNFIARNKNNLPAQLALANLEMAQGHRAEATKALEQAQRDHPEALQPGVLLAGQYMYNGERERALKLARALQVSHPAEPDVIDLVGQIHFANGDYDAALESYSKLAAVRPNSAVAHYRVAQSYMAQGKGPSAAASLKRALAIEPEYRDAQLAQATLDIGNGAYDAAIATARRMQAKPDGKVLGLALEGDVLRAQNKPAAAAKAYEQALGISDAATMLIKMVVALSVAGQEQEANTRLAAWLDKHPKEALDVRLYLGNSARASDLARQSLPHFEAALALAPRNVQALTGLAWAMQGVKDSRALGHAEQAYKLAPEDGVVLDTLGWILAERGDTARAVPLLRKAAEKLPQAMAVRYHLGAALAKAGDRDSARKELTPLAQAPNFSDAAAVRGLLQQL